MSKPRFDHTRTNLPASRLLACVLGLAGLGVPASAEVYLRGNTLGYPPERTSKTLLVLADSSQEGKVWQLTDAKGKVVRSGTLGASITGVTRQSSFAAHHAVDLGTLRDTGAYSLTVPGATPFEVRIRKNPYSFFATKALNYLLSMRSGAEQSGFRKASHLGDTACIPQKPLVPEDGSWTNDGSRKKLDLSGGWYDAGDYIKFTSTIAQTTYFMLRAWETNPGLLGDWIDGGEPAIAILEEARIGLKYLLKTHPNDSTFVIQVGDEADHNQGQRLPQDDQLDGRRPALCAMSPLHMGITSAALALGASVFCERDTALAKACSSQAVRILEHGSAPGVARITYYSGSPINAFYKDDNVYDNLGMGAVELWRLTGDARWKGLARQWSDSAGTQGWINWGNWAIPLNARLAEDSASSTLLRKDMQEMAAYGNTSAKPWNLPMPQAWNPIEPYFSWIGVAADRAQAGDTSWLSQAWDTWDYVLGKNNWGASFLISKNVPNHASSIYNQTYLLLNEFPEGAISLGPGGTSYFTSMSGNFSIPQAELDRVAKFNGKAAVFYDNPTVFLNTETTIDNPATFLYALATLSRLVRDFLPGGTPAPVDKPLVSPAYTETLLPIAKTCWTAFDDMPDSGASKATLDLASDTLVRATLEVKTSDALKYPYAGLSSELFSKDVRNQDWDRSVGIRLRADLPIGCRLWIQLPTDSIKDFDDYGLWIVGKGDTTYDILFDSLAQRGWGKKKAFAKVQVNSFEVLGLSASPAFSIGVRSLSLLSSGAANRIHAPGNRTLPLLRISAGRIGWNLPRSGEASLWLLDMQGRRTRLATGLADQGSLPLPANLASGLYRVALEQGHSRTVIPWAFAR